MTRLSSIFLQFFTLCLLMGISYAVDGNLIRPVLSHRFNFVVSISKRTTTFDLEHLHFCTGTLVGQKRIVTAAHCLEGKTPHEIEIIAGSVKLDLGKKYYPESWITFNQWNPHHGNRPLRKNDIAVIKLVGDGIPEIRPAELFVLDTVHQDNRSFAVTGWGETLKGNKMRNLRRASVRVISNEECSERGTALKGKEFVVPPNYFCTKSDPYVLLTCGDGGAPIFNREEKLVGISVGTCPNLQGYFFNDEEFLRRQKMNTHIRVDYYSDFILHA